MEGDLILIIDDQPEFLEIFSKKLETSGFRVEVADSGKKGIELAKRVKPQLILLDVEMPEMNGAEVLQALRDDPATSDVKAVFLTNLGNPDQEHQDLNERIAREVGALGYLKKTADLDVLVTEIRSYLD